MSPGLRHTPYKCLWRVPRRVSHTSSSWLTVQRSNVNLTIPLYHFLGASAIKSTHSTEILWLHPSLTIFFRNWVLAAITMPVIITFFKLSKRPVTPFLQAVREAAVSKSWMMGIHNCRRSQTIAFCLKLHSLLSLCSIHKSSYLFPSRK